MVDSCSTCSDSDAEKWMMVLMIIQADEEKKMALRDNNINKSKDAESGNTTKRISNGNNAALVISTIKPCTNVNARFSVFERAKRLEQTLSQSSPCFIKLLQTSDLQAGKFLDMPDDFCDEFFTRSEGSPVVVDFILVDEDGKEYEMSYSFRTRRFLGKWMEFYLEHKLASGDALVFSQTGIFKIKVYILKPIESTEHGQANGNQSNPDIHDNPYDTGNARIVKTVRQLDAELPPIDLQAETATPRSNSDFPNIFFRKERLYLDNEIVGGTRIIKTVKPLDVELPPIDVQSETTTPRSNSTNPTPLIDLTDHSSNNSCSDMDISSDMEISRSVPNFMEVKSFEDFKICVDGEILDTKIPPKHRMLYYELCNSQKMFLHEHADGLRSDVVRMIQRTIIIAEATKSANISTSIHDLKNMEREVSEIEDSGMAVGFLWKRMNKLVKYLTQHQINTESRKRKMDQMEDEWTALKKERLTVEKLTKSMADRRSLLGNFENELDTLKEERREIEFMISDVVDSAW